MPGLAEFLMSLMGGAMPLAQQGPPAMQSGAFGQVGSGAAPPQNQPAASVPQYGTGGAGTPDNPFYWGKLAGDGTPGNPYRYEKMSPQEQFSIAGAQQAGIPLSGTGGSGTAQDPFYTGQIAGQGTAQSPFQYQNPNQSNFFSRLAQILSGGGQ